MKSYLRLSLAASILFLTLSYTAGSFGETNIPPVGVADSYSTHSGIEVGGSGVLGNDSDPDGGSLGIGDPPGCRVTSAYGRFCLSPNRDGAFSYAPALGFSGTDSSFYTVCDDRGACTGPITVTFNVSQSPPSGGADVYRVPSIEGIAIPAPGVLANDSDADQDPLGINDAPGCRVTNATGRFCLSNLRDGGFSYLPPPGFTGVDSSFYSVCDGRGGCTTVAVYFFVYCPSGCQICSDAMLEGANGSAHGTQDPVSLVTGRESHTPGPDLSIYNPSGPPVLWQRSYSGSRGMTGYGSPGLSLGWVHAYDNVIEGPTGLGTWGPLKFTGHDGREQTLIPALDGAGAPTGQFTTPAGASYLATGVPAAAAGEWQSITITSKDQTQWRYTPTSPLHAPPSETVWVEDAVPAGAVAAGDGEGWNWVTASPSAFSGSSSHQSNIVGGLHQHFFFDATERMTVGAGETLFAYVYLDPANVPSEVMLQWNSGSWEHRAYWGANLIGWGTDGTDSRRYMGSLPASGGWVKLSVAASQVGLAGVTLNGMAFTLAGGRATWDRAGKMSWPEPLSTMTYVPTKVTNRVGRSVGLSWGADRYLSQVSDTDTGMVLLSLAYDARGKLSTATDAYGRQVSYSFSTPSSTDPGRLASVSQVVAAGTVNPPARYAFTYSNAPHQQLTSISVPSAAGTGSATATINYNANAKVTSLVDANGNRKEITYNQGNTLVQVKDPAGGVVSTWTQKFDGSGRDTGTTDANNKSTVVEYTDAQNPYKPTRVVDRNDKATSYTYDSRGNILTVTTPRNVTTIYTWDYTVFALGRLVSMKEGTKPATTITYFEPSGLVKSITSPSPSGSGTVTNSFTYDALGNVLTLTGPGNNTASHLTTTLNYTTDGAYTQPARVAQPLKITDNLGHSRHLRFDAQGRATSRTDALGNETHFSYNIAGQLEEVTLPPTGQTGSGSARRVDAYLYPGGPLTTSTLYDESNAQARQVTYAYGPEAELLSVAGSTEPVSYTYDALYRLQTLKDGNNNTTTYSYDGVGNVSSVQMPGGETVQFPLYDPSGRALRRVDGNGVTTNYVYDDSENLLTDIQYPATPPLNVHFDYDAFGRRNSMTDATGSHSYVYGDLDELKSVTTTYAGLPAQTISYAYHPDGARQAMTTPAGTFTYGYDGAGRPSSLTNPNSEATSWAYYDNNRPRTQTLANGAQATYTFNEVGQLSRLLNKTGGGTTLSDFSGITHDGAGNRTSITTDVPAATALSGTANYQYDGKDQLTQEQTTRGGGYADSFWYDDAGNPTTFLGASKTYNANNQQAATGFTHDLNGNPTSYGGAGLAFDPENRLTAYGGALTAGYTGDGLRAWKQTAAGRTYFIYDGAVPVLELDSAGAVTSTNTFGAGGLISRRSGAATTFYAFDPQGNVTQRLDAGGAALSSHLFKAHGAEVSAAGPDPFGYGAQWGYYTDRETGLQLLTNRYYDPSAGRFVTRDPISYEGGINLYGYVRNNPLRYADPSGLDGWGNNTADFIEARVSVAEEYYRHAPEEVVANAVNASVAQVVRGFADLFRVGSGVGHAIYDCDDNGYGRAANVLKDVVRAAAIFQMLAGPLAGRTGANCFVAGTQVQTAEGAKSIEDIKAGDVVLSVDAGQAAPAGQSPQGREVVRTFERTATQLVDIRVGGEVITSTPEHPFWVVGAGWTAAGELRRGSALLTKGGLVIHVHSVERREGKFRVYNFEVASSHTYYVSPLGLLVHNTCSTLTDAERAALQEVADEFDTVIDVVGSRAAGRGRNIDTSLPVGKGPGTRSDIDLRVDGQLDINTGGALTDAIRNRLSQAEVRTRLPQGSHPPVIHIKPGGGR